MASVTLSSLIVTASAMLMAACSPAATVTSVTNVCSNPDKASVQVAGYLRLPIAADVVVREPVRNDEQALIIVENINGTGAFVTTSVSTTKTNEPNKVGVLPASYTYNDLHIYTNAGKQITAEDRVIATGEILKNNSGCVLKISRIETL